jgi:hypothetical protein
MDGDLGRQVPALIAVFELAGTAVTLQRGAKVIRPDRHPEFPGKIVEEFGGGGAPAVRLDGLQTGVADRNAERFLTASASALPSGRRRSYCRAFSPSLLGCNRLSRESCQNTFGDFQLIELAAQFFPLGIEPREPLGNPLLLLFLT